MLQQVYTHLSQKMETCTIVYKQVLLIISNTMYEIVSSTHQKRIDGVLSQITMEYNQLMVEQEL